MARKTVKVIPLGGLGEVGKNMTVIEYGNDMMLVDCGLKFPEDDMLGIDYVIPDMTYVQENVEKLRAIVITHGHEDHIGGIPYALKMFNVPIYGTRFAVALIASKMKEHEPLKADLNVAAPGESINIGCFKVEFIKPCHSTAGAVALAIHTPVGVILHTGDFKIDFTPADGSPVDLNRIAQLGAKGVLCMMSDSTNAERPGYTMSEQRIGQTFDRLLKQASGRVIVASFASNIYRTQQIIDTALRYGRKVCFIGRSVNNIVGIASDLGIIDLDINSVIDMDEINNYPDDEVLIITTGSQGETMSGLSRMSKSLNPKVDIGKGDLVIISASPIPGNEKSIYRVINNLYRLGAEVIYQSIEEVHVSGHACQEELKLMLNLVKPKYFIPVHGEYRQLIKHARLAGNMGVPEENAFVLDIGDTLELNSYKGTVTRTVQSGSVLIDGAGVGDVGNVVLRDRKLLSEEGLMVAVVTIGAKSGKLVSGPEIISRGFIYVRESEEIIDRAKEIIRDIIAVAKDTKKGDWQAIKAEIRSKLKNYLTGRNPIILPMVMTADNQ